MDVYGVADAATLSSASVALTDTQPTATANYNFTASGISGTSIKCVQEVYSVASDGTGGVPTGMTTSGTTLDSSTNLITPANFTLAAGSSNGTIAYSYTTGQTPVTTSGAKFNIDGIVNSNTPTTSGYWLTFSTWNGAASGGVCGGSMIDSAVVGFNITTGSTMTLTINPTLTFSVAGTSSGATCNGATSNQVSTSSTIPFGVVTPSTNSVVCQQLTAATNATNGYTVYVRDTGQLANTLSQTIHDWTGTNASPTAFSAAGTENYGYTTDSTSESGFQPNKWAGFNHTAGGNSALNNEPIATTSTPASSSNINVGFQAGVSVTTKPGSYQTTVVYTCTPVY